MLALFGEEFEAVVDFPKFIYLSTYRWQGNGEIVSVYDKPV
jgi:hypothetical protein